MFQEYHKGWRFYILLYFPIKYGCYNIFNTTSGMERHFIHLPLLHFRQDEAKSQGASNALLWAHFHQDIIQTPSIKA